MFRRSLFVLLMPFVVAALAVFAVVAQDDPIEVPAILETAPTLDDNANGVTIWLHPDEILDSAFIGADEDGGLQVMDLDGEVLHVLDEGATTNLDLRYNFPLGGQSITLISAVNQDTNQLHFYTIDPDTRELSRLNVVDTGVLVVGVCMYVSPRSGTYYAFVTSEEASGIVKQFALTDDGDGGIAAEEVRALYVGSESEGCAADDETGVIYLAEEDVAIWRYSAEPEAVAPRRVVDYVGGEGNISEAVEGLSLYFGADQTGYLIASDEAANRFLVYERDGDNAYVGMFTVGAGEGIDAVQEANGIEVLSYAIGDAYPDGVFITTDDNNTQPNADTNYKIVSWADIASALDLRVETLSDPRDIGLADVEFGVLPQVTARVQTDSSVSTSDAADDAAIWIHPTDPALSTIIGTDKGNNGGFGVYDLSGAQLQFVTIGEVNNVDLRYNFPLGGENVAVVVGSDRTSNSIAAYTVDPDTRELVNAASRTLSVGLREIYGICLYVSPVDGEHYVFVNSTREGDVEQYRMFDDGSGMIDIELVRSFNIGTQTEGCVADDEFGVVYIGEEDEGFWKFDAEPDGSAEGTLVDTTAEGGNLTADVEGITLYYGEDGAGYLLVSSQGSSSFVVYEREGDNAFVGAFQVGEGEFADAVTGTDGIDVTNFPLNDTFPDGVFVVQDDRKINPAGNQNYKLIAWSDIAAALDLAINTAHDPRTVGAE